MQEITPLEKICNFDECVNDNEIMAYFPEISITNSVSNTHNNYVDILRDYLPRENSIDNSHGLETYDFIYLSERKEKNIPSFYGAELMTNMKNEEGVLRTIYLNEYEKMMKIRKEKEVQLSEKYHLIDKSDEELYLLDKSTLGIELTKELYTTFKSNQEMKNFISLFKPHLLIRYDIQ